MDPASYCRISRKGWCPAPVVALVEVLALACRELSAAPNFSLDTLETQTVHDPVHASVNSIPSSHALLTTI
jgi:hypothetical protein